MHAPCVQTTPPPLVVNMTPCAAKLPQIPWKQLFVHTRAWYSATGSNKLTTWNSILVARLPGGLAATWNMCRSQPPADAA